MHKQFHLIIFSNKLDEAISFEHLTFQTSILNASVLLCVPVCVCAHLLCGLLMHHTVDVFLLLLKLYQSESMQLVCGRRKQGQTVEAAAQMGITLIFSHQLSAIF